MQQNESTVSLPMAVVTILVTLIVVIMAGYYIGNSFFWNPTDTRTLSDRRYDEVTQLYKKNPKDKNVALGYAISLYQKGDKAGADKIFGELIKKFPKDNAVLFNYAAYKNTTGNVKEAKVYYEKVLKNAPYFIPANVQYGIIIRDEGKYEEALVKFNNALKMEPGAADILVERAKAYIGAKQPEKAKEDLIQALKFVPDYSEAQKLLKQLK